MRKTMNLGILCIVLLGLAKAQNPSKTDTPAAAVSGSGCVEQGVESGCLVLKDRKTGTLYNLFFTGKKPSAGTAIEFSGTVHDGPTTCMQGKPVNVKEKGWKQINLQCKSTSGQKP
jgi:hypothetical protein